MYDSSEIANRIRSIAKLKNISISFMLNEIGLGKNTIAKMSDGSDILSQNLAKIADYLKVSIDYLVGRTTIPTVFSDYCNTTNHNDSINFYKIFETLCNASGKRVNTVGKELGISSGSISQWKNGAIPSGEKLVQLADYFNVPIDYLLGRTIVPTKISNYYNDNKLSDIISVIKHTIDNIDFEKELRNIEDLRYQAFLRDKASHDESELKLIAQNKVIEKVCENLKAKGCSDDFIKDVINGSKCFDI